ncbi:hypothetical protein Esti_001293 [Eimeria stiedai]
MLFGHIKSHAQNVSEAGQRLESCASEGNTAAELKMPIQDPSSTSARVPQQEVEIIVAHELDGIQRDPEYGSKPSSAGGRDHHGGATALHTGGPGEAVPEAKHCQTSQKNRARTLFNTSSRCSGTKDLVKRTREAFLLQMAVDTRKAEILKLHEKAARKAEYLNKAESLLSKDAQKFDELLRSSDAAAHDAICEADNAARVAQEKAVAVRQLRQKLDATRARTALKRERVEEYLRYKAFLTHITPQEKIQTSVFDLYECPLQEWLKVQEEQSRERVEQQKHNWVQQQMEQQLQQHAAEMETIEDNFREKLQELERKKYRRSKAGNAARRELEEKAERRRKHLTRKLKSQADFEISFDAGKTAIAGLELYFQDPHEPLRLFRELEEENLFLIQNVQESVTVWHPLR